MSAPYARRTRASPPHPPSTIFPTLAPFSPSLSVTPGTPYHPPAAYHIFPALLPKQPSSIFSPQPRLTGGCGAGESDFLCVGTALHRCSARLTGEARVPSPRWEARDKDYALPIGVA